MCQTTEADSPALLSSFCLIGGLFSGGSGAENFAIGAGGCVIRLAGLYSVDRGPHNLWLTMKKVLL